MTRLDDVDTAFLSDGKVVPVDNSTVELCVMVIDMPDVAIAAEPDATCPPLGKTSSKTHPSLRNKGSRGQQCYGKTVLAFMQTRQAHPDRRADHHTEAPSLEFNIPESKMF